MSKYKYYFKKPKSEIVKDIFKLLLISGAVCIAATSPYFIRNLIKGIKNFRKYNKRKVHDAFYNLRRTGDIVITKKRGQIYISLTEKGKKKAGWMQIDALEIKKPKRWDKKWRIVMFDIAELKRFYREAFRGKLKELEFYPLQKSVWVCPYNCSDEIALLKKFFGLSEKDIRVVVTEEIEKDRELRNAFRV